MQNTLSALVRAWLIGVEAGSSRNVQVARNVHNLQVVLFAVVHDVLSQSQLLRNVVSLLTIPLITIFTCLSAESWMGGGAVDHCRVLKGEGRWRQ